MNRENIDLLLPSGGYHKLKSFQLARLIYDITVRFTELYIPQNSRTVDQIPKHSRRLRRCRDIHKNGNKLV